MKPKKPKSAPGKPDVITEKEKRFAEEYVKDYNASRAYIAAGYKSDNAGTVAVGSCRLRQSDRVWEYIQSIQRDIEKVTGITRAKILQMHRDIAETSIAHLHKTWVTREEFEKLTDVQKMAIQEIDTKVRKVPGKKTEVEYVRIKLYDRQKSLEAIARMVGYNEPDKFEINANKETLAGLFPFGK